MKIDNPIYDINLSYEENKKRGPQYDGDFPTLDYGTPIKDFLGYKVYGPVGIAAGPLLDSKWINFYAKFGFPILTYKTVRSRKVPAHPNPNIVFVETDNYLKPKDIESIVYARTSPPSDISHLTITNSFGVPSDDPDNWIKDIKSINLQEGFALVISVMGTGNGFEELLEDYLYTAKLAYDNGAKIIEVNLSCPNIGDDMGFLYQNIDFVRELSSQLRKAINVPLILKIGYFPTIDNMAEFVKALNGNIDAIAGINSVRMKVLKSDGTPALPSIDDSRAKSGVCGWAILSLGLDFVHDLSMVRESFNEKFAIIGMGGVTQTSHIERYLQAGADFVQMATIVMWDPFISYDYLHHND